MGEKRKNIVIVCLCLVICICLGLTVWALNREEPEGPNPNVTLVTTPEQTGFEEHPEWTIPVTEPIDYGENLCLGKEAKQSGQTDIYNCRNVCDGDRYTYWEGETDDYPNDVTVDLEESVQMGSARVLLNPSRIWGARTQDIEVLVSEDGENFVTAYPRTTLSFDPNTDNSVYMEFGAPAQGRYVRFQFYANTGAKGGQAAEVEVYAPKS